MALKDLKQESGKASLNKDTGEMELNKKHLSLIYDTLSDATFFLVVEPDDCFRFMSVNRAFLDITGLSREQVVGKRIENVLPKTVHAPVISKYKEAVNENKTVFWEEVSIGPTGERVGAVTLTPICDGAGVCTHLIGSVHDFTERKQAEEKEKEHHKNIQLLSETAMRFIEFPQDEDIYTFVGEQLRELTGKDSYIIINSVDAETSISTIRAVLGLGKFTDKIDKIVGRHLVGMTFKVKDLNQHHADGKMHLYKKGLYGLLLKTVPKTLCKSMENLLNIQKIYTIDLTKHGGFFGSVTVLFKKGAPELKDPQVIETFIKQASIAIQHKQAEETLRESEKQLQTLIDAMPDFVCFKDGDGHWLKVNDASIRIFQLEDIDYRGKNDFELAEINSKLQGAFLTCNESDAMAWHEGSNFHGEEMISRPDGTVRFYDVTKVPVFHSHGGRKGIVVLGHDITERKHAEKKLRKLNDELLSLDKMKDEFLSNVSHELKTPLVSIKGYNELLYDGSLGALNEQQKKAMEVVFRNSERLGHLIDSLVYLNMEKAGKVECKFDSLQIADIIKQATLDTLPVSENHNLTLAMDVPDDLPPISGDVDRLTEVIINLLDNAIKFTPSGGEITVVAHDETDNIHITVTDTGIGISSKHLQKIFDRFYQADASTTRRYGGTGLGLYIVKTIVEMHNGQIWAEGEKGIGTTFHVLLPK